MPEFTWRYNTKRSSSSLLGYNPDALQLMAILQFTLLECGEQHFSGTSLVKSFPLISASMNKRERCWSASWWNLFLTKINLKNPKWYMRKCWGYITETLAWDSLWWHYKGVIFQRRKKKSSSGSGFLPPKKPRSAVIYFTLPLHHHLLPSRLPESGLRTQTALDQCRHHEK